MRSRWNQALPWKHYTKLSYIDLCICCKKVIDYILLYATIVIKVLKFYFTNKKKINKIFGNFHPKIYPPTNKGSF